jgi:phosphopantetheinyl transferase
MLKLYIAKLYPSETPHDAAMRALDMALSDTYGKRLSDFQLKKTQSGKPFFAGCDNIKFNISHSGDYSVAALSDSDVGVDIERIRPVNPRIADRFLRGIATGTSYDKIIEAWCKKESYGKFTGAGLLGADFSLPHHIQVFDFVPGYKIAVCSVKKQTAEIILF